MLGSAIVRCGVWGSSVGVWGWVTVRGLRTAGSASARNHTAGSLWRACFVAIEAIYSDNTRTVGSPSLLNLSRWTLARASEAVRS